MARTKLEQILINRGLKQTDLSNLIIENGFKEIGKDRLNRMCSGNHTNYTIETLLTICSVLNVTPNEIVEYETN